MGVCPVAVAVPPETEDQRESETPPLDRVKRWGMEEGGGVETA